MARIKFSTLTEQMFYVLLCLRREYCGMDIMDRVPEMTGGRVQLGAGTLYNLLDEFTDAGMICLTRSEGRRRSYILTGKGRDALLKEKQRMLQLISDYDSCFGEERDP